jgi:hypothetical protein
VTIAHGGTAGLVFELSFLVVPVLLFTVLAVVSSRRSKRTESPEEEKEGQA